MTEHQSQRVALVTGGAVRVGRSISLALADAGYDLAVHFRGSEAQARELAEHVRGLGRRCALVQGDLMDPAVPETIVASVREALGRLDLLVNNAAGFDSRPLLDVDSEAWDDIMALNARAPHLLVRAAASLLTESSGCVVNIADLSAYQPWTEHPIHAVSKAALAHLTRVQARALAPAVRVNGLAPGAVLPPDDYPPERLETLRVRTPLQRLGTPEDVAKAVVFLANADFITGQVIAVDGGRLLGPKGPPGGA